MTIKDIAELAGVSIGTVDRVIHNRGKVAEKTRKKIQLIIDTSGFRPNAFASNLKLNTEHIVGILLPLISSTERGYWDLIHQGILKATTELGNQRIKVKIFKFSRDIPGSFSKIARDMVEKHNITSAIIAPVCREETVGFLKEHKNLKFIYVDTPLAGTTPICTIAQDPYQSGFLGGRIMSILTDRPTRFIVVRTYNSYNSLERTRGFKDYFPKNTLTEVHGELIVNSKKVNEFIADLYKRFGIIDGIFVACSAITSSIGDAVVNLRKKENTSVLGYDLIKENCIALEKGKIDCIFSQRPLFQGYNAMYSMYRELVLKQSPSSLINIRTDIIFRENLYEEDLSKNVIVNSIPL